MFTARVALIPTRFVSGHRFYGQFKHIGAVIIMITNNKNDDNNKDKLCKRR